MRWAERYRLDGRRRPCELLLVLSVAKVSADPVSRAIPRSVVMDEVLVEAPYDPSPALGHVKSNNQQRKERVIKVLQGERSKLEKTKPHLFGQQGAGS